MTLEHQTRVALLAGLSWFSPLASDQIDRLAASAETAEWEAGETVFEEGERGDQCYVIHSGRVRVLRWLLDGRPITLATLGPGDIFGEFAMFGGELRSATVEAVVTTVAIALAAPDVMTIFRGDANAALRAAVGLADRLRATNERLFESSMATVTGSVVATLMAQVEARRRQGDRGAEIEVAGGPSDVAKLAGAGREGTMRVLHWLENEGIITIKRGKIIVHEPDALSRVFT